MVSKNDLKAKPVHKVKVWKRPAAREGSGVFGNDKKLQQMLF